MRYNKLKWENKQICKTIDYIDLKFNQNKKL